MAGVLRNGGASIWILEWQSFQCVRVRFFESGRASVVECIDVSVHKSLLNDVF